MESNFSTFPFLTRARCIVMFFLLVQKPEHLRDTFVKSLRGRDQAYDQVSITGEIVKVPRMNQHGKPAQNFNSKVFVRLRHRNPQHCIPSPFNVEAATGFLFSQCAVQFVQVRTHAVQ